jgi:1-acyl-sn-glycerol-3-phosphate acyltransferase
MTNEEAHRMARERGVSKPLYAIFRGLLRPLYRIYFRLRIEGAENIPAEGAAIVTPNHKSFWDSFFIAAATKRNLRFMGKSELFEGRHGRLLVRLGAFPVRRGESDAEALETARQILQQGGLLSLFPEGTRIRDPEELGRPHRGAARLALETGSVLVPAAITGTSKMFLGPIPKPKRVQVAFAEPIEVHELDATPEVAEELTDSVLWPNVEQEFTGLRAHPGLIAAGLAAAGIGVGLAAKQRSKGRRKKKRGLRIRR